MLIPLAIAGYFLYPVVKDYLDSKKHEACDEPLSSPDKAIEACTDLIDSGLDPKHQAAAYNNRGLAHQSKGDLAAAISDFDTAIKIRPVIDMYRNRADTYNKMKNFAKALADYNKAVALAPSNGSALNNLAWFLATCPSAAHRDGRRAVTLATQALRLERSAGRLDTLAASFAEARQFKNAIRTQQQAVALTQNPEVRKRLELYKRSKPYRAAAH